MVKHEQMARVFSVPVPDALQSFSSHEAYCYIGDSLLWLRKKISDPGLQVTLPTCWYHPKTLSIPAAKEGQKGNFSHWAVHLTIRIVSNGKHSEEAIIWLDFQVRFSRDTGMGSDLRMRYIDGTVRTDQVLKDFRSMQRLTKKSQPWGDSIIIWNRAAR